MSAGAWRATAMTVAILGGLAACGGAPDESAGGAAALAASKTTDATVARIVEVTSPPETTTTEPPPPTSTTTTARPAPPVTQTFAAAATPTDPTSGNCHPGYPDDCIPPAPPDLDCPDIGHRVRVDHGHGDPHGLDREKDGVGCES